MGLVRDVDCLTGCRASGQIRNPCLNSYRNPASNTSDYHAVLQKYCITCHNERTKIAGLMLDKLDVNNVAGGADTWEKVVRKVRVGMMPPQGSPRPDQDTRQSLVTWLASELDRASAANLNPGRGLIHRFNRAEYANAIRDLFALDVDTSSMLPPTTRRTASTTSPTPWVSRLCCWSDI